jgi:hypothetical protein
MTKTQMNLIDAFHAAEASGNHSEEYLAEITEQETLVELVGLVAHWVRECEGDSHKAAMYILWTLDQELG